MEGAVRVDAKDARCEDTRLGHEVATEDQDGMGERGVRALRLPAPLLLPPLVEGDADVEQAGEDKDEDALATKSLVGDAVYAAGFVVRPVGDQSAAEDMEESLKRASAGDTFGYRNACGRKASKMSSTS